MAAEAARGRHARRLRDRWLRRAGDYDEHTVNMQSGYGMSIKADIPQWRVFMCSIEAASISISECLFQSLDWEPGAIEIAPMVKIGEPAPRIGTPVHNGLIHGIYPLTGFGDKNIVCGFITALSGDII
jgi:hypothetical protein